MGNMRRIKTQRLVNSVGNTSLKRTACGGTTREGVRKGLTYLDFHFFSSARGSNPVLLNHLESRRHFGDGSISVNLQLEKCSAYDGLRQQTEFERSSTLKGGTRPVTASRLSGQRSGISKRAELAAQPRAGPSRFRRTSRRCRRRPAACADPDRERASCTSSDRRTSSRGPGDRSRCAGSRRILSHGVRFVLFHAVGRQGHYAIRISSATLSVTPRRSKEQAPSDQIRDNSANLRLRTTKSRRRPDAND